MMNTLQDLHLDFGMDLRAFEENQSQYNAERCIRGINRFKEFGDALDARWWSQTLYCLPGGIYYSQKVIELPNSTPLNEMLDVVIGYFNEYK